MSPATLHDLFIYDPKTGKLFWRVNKRAAISGTEAGSIKTSPRGATTRALRIDGKTYTRARLVWLMHYDTLPNSYLLHVNGNSLDDRIENLSIGERVLRTTEPAQLNELKAQ